MTTARRPWLTAALLALTLALARAPGGWQAGLLFEREALLRGELWRLWTGHLIHFSASHLVWDLLAAGATGAWLECGRVRGAGWYLLAAPALISLTLLAGEPQLLRYGGLSALATGAAALAAVAELRRPGRGRLLGAALLVLLGAKLLWEFRGGGPLLADYAGSGIRSVPLSHLAGFVCGLGIGAWFGSAATPEQRLDRPGS